MGHVRKVLVAGLIVSCLALVDAVNVEAQDTLYVANAFDNVAVVDVPTLATTKTVPAGQFPAAMTVSPDGRVWYIATVVLRGSNLDGQLLAVDTSTLRIIHQVSGVPVGQDLAPTSLVWAQDGSSLYLSAGGRMVAVDPTTLATTASLQLPGRISPARSPGHVFVVSGFGLNQDIRLVDVTSGATQASVPGTSEAIDIVSTRSGAAAYAITVSPPSASMGYVAKVFYLDGSTGALQATVHVPARINLSTLHRLALSRDEKRLYAFSDASGGSMVFQIELASHAVTGQFSAPGVSGIVASADGTRLFVIAPGLLRVVSTATLQTIATAPLPQNARTAVGRFLDEDTDHDGLPDAWEQTFGLDPNSAAGADGTDGDPDQDGAHNLQEHQAGTHPRSFQHRYLAEGVNNQFFQTQFALLNPGSRPAHVLLRLQPETDGELSYPLRVPPHTRVTIGPSAIASLLAAPSFATTIESDEIVVVDRTVTWGGGYGSNSETALSRPESTWYLAEGSTGGPFDTFYLLQNPNDVAVTAQVTYLLPIGNPLVKTYTVPARGRYTIYVDEELFPDGHGGQTQRLAGTDLSGIVQVQTDCGSAGKCPIVVERAMYLSRPDQPFAAGHNAAGVSAPALHWFLAEGATGPLFDMYILLANPNPLPVRVTVNYLLTSGTPLTKDYLVAPASRYTIHVNEEEIPVGSGRHPLSGATLSTSLDADQPIVVERAIWWPRTGWHEAHAVAGSTQTGTTWAIAEGEQGGPNATHTYVLIANLGDQPADVRLTAMLESGATSVTTVQVAPKSRYTVEMADQPFVGINGARFGVLVESLNAQPIVVERSMYSDYQGQFWAAGTAALASCLDCPASH
jgi:YVTN family beta-propeller protein